MASPANPIEYVSSHDAFAAQLQEVLRADEVVPKDGVVPVDPSTVVVDPVVASMTTVVPVPPVEMPGTPTPAPAALPAAPPAAAPTPVVPPAPAIEIPTDLDEISFEEAKEGEEGKPATPADPNAPPPPPADPNAPTPPSPLSPGPTTEQLNAALAAAGIDFTLDQLKDPDFTEKQLSAVLSTPRGRAMYGTWKEFRDLQQPPDPTDPSKGGLGFIPKVAELQDWRRAYLANESLRSDFETSPVDFLLNLFGPVQVVDPETGGHKLVLTPASREVVKLLPQAFREHAPDHYRVIAQNILTDQVRYVTSDQFLARLGTDEDRENVRYAASVFRNIFLKGASPGTSGSSALAPSTAPPPTDPAARAEWEAIEAEKRALATQRHQAEIRRQQESQRQFESAQSQIVNTVANTVLTGIRNSVAPIVNYYKQFNEPEATIQALYDRIAGEVADLISGNQAKGILPMDRQSLDLYGRQLAQAARAGDLKAPQALRTYQRLAEMAIRKVVPPLLSQYAQRTASTNQAVHQQATVAAAQVAPVAAAASVPASVVPSPDLQRGANESMQEYYKRAFQQQFQAGGVR